MSERELYLVLGDVVSSREIEDKTAFQKKLHNAIETINRIYRKDIYADFKILKGIDEIGGVLLSVANSYEIVASINDYLHPDAMRFVILRGKIEIGLETQDVSQMDGPVFHKAAALMAQSRKSESLFVISVGFDEIDTLVSNIINLILAQKYNWYPHQAAVVREYRYLKNQKKVAEKLGLTQQAVSKVLKYLNWKEIAQVEQEIDSALGKYDELVNR